MILMKEAVHAQPRGRQQLLALLLFVAVCFLLNIWGVIWSFCLSYAEGSYGNHYSAVWVCGLSLVMCIQAVVVSLNPQATVARRARFYAWIWYSIWMWCAGITILIGLSIALPEQSGWAAFWLVIPLIILACSILHSKHAAQHNLSVTADVEAVAIQPRNSKTWDTTTPATSASSSTSAPCCSRLAWHSCCSGFGLFLAWSSLFWLSVLAFFLALQAAWLAADKLAYPPPGQLVEVQMDLQEGSTVPARLHIYCTGPKTPGLSTFILEGGGGSPGIALAGIADALAASGRRACWYDRLGYGWSDNAIKPATPMRATHALHSLLATPGVAEAPYIIAGHSAGGQLALAFAAAYPKLVAGVALLDSYSDVAISRYMLSDASSQQLPTKAVAAQNGSVVQLPDTSSYYGSTVSLTDVLRAVTPLAWGRFITGTSKPGQAYGAATAALYGNNNVWHAQWVEVLAMAAGSSTADTLTLLSNRAVWYGAGWPDLGSKPVILMPAESTLKLPAGCAANFGSSDICQYAVHNALQWCKSTDEGRARGKRCVSDLVYADLYLAYLHSLSSNTSLDVMPGSHSFPWAAPNAVADKLLAKFARV